MLLLSISLFRSGYAQQTPDTLNPIPPTPGGLHNSADSLQKKPRILDDVLKIDLIVPLFRQIHVAWEHPKGKSRSREWQLGVKFEPQNAANLSPGTTTINYILSQSDTVLLFSNNSYHTGKTSWVFEKGTHSLPEAPAAAPLFTAYIAYGSRFYFGNPEAKIRLFMQPGVRLTVQQNYRVQDEFRELHREEYRYYVTEDFRTYSIDKETVYYEQTRKVWANLTYIYAGFHYDLGFRARVGKRLSLETTLLCGMNVAKDQQAQIRSSLARQLTIGAGVNAGWWF